MIWRVIRYKRNECQMGLKIYFKIWAKVEQVFSFTNKETTLLMTLHILYNKLKFEWKATRSVIDGKSNPLFNVSINYIKLQC